MAWGLTKNGFNRPNQAQLKEELDQKQREMYGEDINLSYKSPNGIFSGLLSWVHSKLWELAEKIYKGSHVTGAEGIQLDYLTPFFYTTRKVQQNAEVFLSITGKPFYTIEAGTRYETETGVDFAIKTDITLDEAGYGLIDAVSINDGTVGNVPANTITIQSEPSAYVFTVTNLEAATEGRERETDAELVERLLNSPSNNGSATIDSIRSSVLNVPGVRSATVQENNTNKVVNGQAEKSFQVFSFGGDGQEIAEAIFKKGAGGIQPFGTTSYTVKDLSGNPHEVAFTPAFAIDVYVTIDLTVDSSFRADGMDQIKQKIENMISGSASDGFVTTGLDMGEDVIRFQIERSIGDIQGVKDAVVYLGKNPMEQTQGNIVIAPHEIAVINKENITVRLLS